MQKGHKKLTVKQEKFCQEYIKCGDASKSYREAYNTAKMKMETINSRAYELLKNGEIKARVQELSNEIKSKSIADAEEIQETLTRLMRGEVQEECVSTEGTGNGVYKPVIFKKQVTPKDRIKAGETLAKMRGYFDIKIKVENAPIIKDDI